MLWALSAVLIAGPTGQLDRSGPRPLVVAGHVRRATASDTLAGAGLRVILHRVTTQHSGPIDSTLSDPHGAFRFHLVPDSSAVYLVSSRWAGIEYFAAPVDLTRGDDSAIVVITSDTSSRAPVQLAARHLIVSPVTEDGVRNVVDLFVLENHGPLTRAVRDTTLATWDVRLPRYAVNIHGGRSDFALETLRLVGDTVKLHAPIPPGQREVEIDYQIAPGATRFVVPVDHDAPVSQVISEDASLRVEPDFRRADSMIEGKRYTRWQGSMQAGRDIVLVFGGGRAPSWIVGALIAAMAVMLLLITWRKARPR